MHKLALRQFRKAFGDFESYSPEVLTLLNKISDSYDHYESSQNLLQHSMEIASEELFETNNKLREDLDERERLIDSLKESLKDLNKDIYIDGDVNLMQLAEALQLEALNRKKIESELVEAREIAENSLKSREMFFANMSHEIRTPMNAIIGMSHLLKNTSLDEDQTTYQRVIHTSAKDLVVIINDILDITKISSGKLSLEEVGFSLSELVNDISKLLGYRANEKGLGLEINLDKDINSYLKSDPIRLKQVLINLIGNAIKFTPKGEVILNLKLVNKAVDSDTILFEIIDSGIGIAEDRLKSIFNSFSQENKSTTREYGGTGLGLSISKRLVEMLGGTLAVDSIKDKGSRFYFTITLPHNSSPIITEVLTETKDLKGCNILLVEDNEINVFLATTILERWNANITSVLNGKLATDRMSKNDYDIVLMDMQMPIMNGIEATKYIRMVLELDTPIIGFTANALRGEKEKCFKAGMNDYITKPFSPDDLYTKICGLLRDK